MQCARSLQLYEAFFLPNHFSLTGLEMDWQLRDAAAAWNAAT